MTCIVGLEHDGKVWMGGDAAASDSEGNDIRRYASPKVFAVTRGTEPFLMGFTHSFRMGQILQFSLTPPTCGRHRDPFEYMVNDFADALREVYKTKGFLSSDDEGTERGGTFLVGFRGSLYIMESDFHVAQPDIGKLGCAFHAVGCGDNPALGSLYSTQRRGPENRCYTALAAAAVFCSAVRAPFTVLSL
jgi:ATP-dependent protease HslVU (ClpYQ) peptidase subunit